MGNRKARELKRKQEDDALWHRVQTVPRPASGSVFVPGIGLLRIQLIVCPSFEEAQAWEVRQGAECWRLFRPHVVNTSPEVQLIGCDPFEFPSVRLASFFQKMADLSIPLMPDLSGHGGLDGTTYQLALFGDLYSSWQFKWWSDPPKHWHSLHDIAEEMLAAFNEINTSKTDQVTYSG